MAKASQLSALQLTA